MGGAMPLLSLYISMVCTGTALLYCMNCSLAGYPFWHFDLQICDNPLEAGLDILCKKTGDYLGKTALDVVREKGLAKKLLHFQLRQ